MRDVFEDIFSTAAVERLDPTEAARRNMRSLRKRFYKDATVGEDGFAILLDGRPIRTPARSLLAAPRRALADAMAAEWRAQAEYVDPAGMPLTRLANTIIDGVTAAGPEVADEIAKYLGSDLLVYRASGPAGLVARQKEHWDPVLDWARTGLGAPFAVGEGVIHVPQADATIAAARAVIPSDPWRLGAVHAITTLTGSALLALAVASGRLDRDTAWAAAHVDDDWNADFWGRDDQALQRRAFRYAEMTAADLVLTHVEEKATG